MSFVKTAVKVDPGVSAEKARSLLRQADGVGSRNDGRKARTENEGLSNYPCASFLASKQEIKLRLKAAESFRLAGEHHWHDSANAYAVAAALHAEDLGDQATAARLFTEAAVVAEKVDSSFSNDYYRKAVSKYCDAAQYKEAAVLEERTAKSHGLNKDLEASVAAYERAAKLYIAANAVDCAGHALGQHAFLLGKSGKAREAARAYEYLATFQAKQNTKTFNVSQTMLRAGVLLLSDCLQQSSELDYSKIQQMMETVYELDCRFAESREHAFLVDLVQSVPKGDLDKFADCLYSFNTISEFDDVMLDALERIKNAIVAEIK